ncbi:L-homoserine-O-acetyltransferase [Elasticomyces elasticus]|uniref:Homoserine O- acetyltransferase n=1 Tax=Exophiala sideris TaxID=1016849 RepID=A0ABR0IW03_9EURO|nr:L-homoserine-O-acetyltransferase [Elasticomyces elasticus]KAK5021455.1 homoserine O- acetyltransferase [Exophiala sideris]KAK5024521.1 L-homoserine-O-acetyltransferase [Exophiala sideris]KAK5049587.1 homoserine O- acetyltransferase [Exophiala sideris]KAK5176618.1 homoserine O- acetyltransferase [Eurotiomycetes sp. CCFEE 6388]
MAVDFDAQPPNNYYANLVRNLKVAVVPYFTLDTGHQLIQVPVAYSSWGTLNKEANNALIVCHALTGSSDIQDWWKPLLGPGKAFDPTRFFVICFNLLGSPYGSASPLTLYPLTGKPYGPAFPQTTFRDDVRIQKMVLDALGVRQVAAVVGGSMGGQLTLEWPLCTPPGYVKTIIPIATSAFQGAWGISWNESQIRCVQADAQFQGGNYDPHPEGQPIQGLGAARMIGMLTYRSYTSFEARFSRRRVDSRLSSKSAALPEQTPPTPPASDAGDDIPEGTELKTTGSTATVALSLPSYTAQSYLQYQADKFLGRFDANCYVHLLRKMDTHDITRDRTSATVPLTEAQPEVEALAHILSKCLTPALVVSIDSDMLFPPEQQVLLAAYLPDATLVKLQSSDGHDGFLLELETMDGLIRSFLLKHIPAAFAAAPILITQEECQEENSLNSVFGEMDSHFQ